MTERRYRTGEVAAHSGVSIATLRYYERRGLIAEPVRSPSGYRAYPAETIDTVRLIKSAQALGFTLKEIGALLELRASDESRCSAAADLARSKVGEIEDRIATLQGNLEALRRLLEACRDHSHSPARDCPMFDELAGRDKKPEARRA